MSIELLVQFLVLAATAALFWVARRDLMSRPAAPSAPPGEDAAHLAELEQLCATLEALAASLARRLDAVERQLAEARAAVPLPEPPAAPRRKRPAAAVPPPAVAAEEPPVAPSPEPPPAAVTESAPPLSGERPPAPVAEDPPPDPRHLAAFALLDAGMTDPVEIGRQTGLGRGEVDLILNLRARRAL